MRQIETVPLAAMVAPQSSRTVPAARWLAGAHD